MKIHFFLLKINRDEWLRYYRGEARTVMITSLQGLRISLPAIHFRAHTTENGIQGLFRLTLDQNNKFIRLERLK